ncbi:hypothetical protein [Isoptericola croceus]|uniref:hypothetical protein n=1 Tax=Isoptericola croceus TaxID=3031406 RepID=UPI0023F66BA1|nr:hypothetical protein [Isoptericola croceus]
MTTAPTGAGTAPISGATAVDELLGEQREALGPLMPRLGLTVYLAARLEFTLRFVHSVATNKRIDHRVPQRNLVDEAIRAVEHGESSIEVGLVKDWLHNTSRTLDMRGGLAHALWSVTSDILPEDMRRTGMTEDEVASHVPGLVHRSELRIDQTLATSPEDLDTLCSEMNRLLENGDRIVKMTKRAASRPEV